MNTPHRHLMQISRSQECTHYLLYKLSSIFFRHLSGFSLKKARAFNVFRRSIVNLLKQIYLLSVYNNNYKTSTKSTEIGIKP